jgi:hypothetical protein
MFNVFLIVTANNTHLIANSFNTSPQARKIDLEDPYSPAKYNPILPVNLEHRHAHATTTCASLRNSYGKPTGRKSHILTTNLGLQIILGFLVVGALTSPTPMLSTTTRSGSHASPSPIQVRSDTQNTGKMTVSAIILLVFGGICEFWIVFALVFAALSRRGGRPYLVRVRDALKCQLH